MQTQANNPAQAKPAKRVRKQKQAEVPAIVTTEAVAKPDASERKAKAEARAAERQAAVNDRSEARKLAAQAVNAYYNGASLPFKAAADRFADLRTDKPAKKPTQRQAALLASMLLAGDNVQADGTFMRGGFTLDGKRVQPETGALSDMLHRVIHYVSGPTSGNGQAESILRIDLARAAVEIREHIGGALASAALARIDTLTAPKA